MTATLTRPGSTSSAFTSPAFTGTAFTGPASPGSTPSRRSPIRPGGAAALETTCELDVLCREPARPAPRTGSRSVRRPSQTAPARPMQAGRRTAGTRCAGATRDEAVYTRRRAWAAAVLVGAGLAAIAAIMTIAGNNYAASVAPQPISTEVIHVRSGESLSAVAARVAPDMPTDVVVRTIIDLNNLDSSTLQTGQALVAPEYR